MNKIAIPKFLPFIYPSFLGFGGGIFIAILFIYNNKGKAPRRKLVIRAIQLYVASILTGHIFYEANLTQDLSSAYYISGIFAPLLYALIATILIRRKFLKSQKTNKSDLDHFIQG